MADAVATQTLVNGPVKLVMQFNNLSDGTGENNVVKVDKSTYTNINGVEPTQMVIEAIEGDCAGMEVCIRVNLTTPINLIRLGGLGRFHIDYREQGGLQTKGAGGSTGDLEFTTNGATSGDSYNIVLHMRKQ